VAQDQREMHRMRLIVTSEELLVSPREARGRSSVLIYWGLVL
jgi:hypothetical protein